MSYAETLYVAPGDRQCRIYVIPYPMRPGQSPGDIAHKFQSAWKEVGLLNGKLELVCLDEKYHQHKQDLDGAYPGTFFGVDVAISEAVG